MKRHAYLIIAHNEPEVLTALLHALDVDWNDIYLHIDKRSVSLRSEMTRMQLDKARLFVLSDPIAVYWAHTSQIAVELMLMKTAAEKGPYAYYHLLSGCDLPIKSQQTIYDFFEANKGKEFVGYWHGEAVEKESVKRVRYYYVLNRYKRRASFLRHILTTPFRNLFLNLQKVLGVNRLRGKNIEIKKGSQWFSITESCCRYVLEHEEKVWRIFRYSLCPDELFLQTVIWDSPFRACLFDVQDACRGSMRAIDWQRGNPYVWREEDVEGLIKSPYLFARKFSSVEMKAVQRLAVELKK